MEHRWLPVASAERGGGGRRVKWIRWVKNLVMPVLEEHLRTVLGGFNGQDIDRELEACTTKVEAAASSDLGKMGLDVVSFTVQSTERNG